MKLRFIALALMSPVSAFALINGSILKGNGDLVRLVFKNGWVCSGAFIDPYTILTAGHCVSGVEDPALLKQVLTENDEALDIVPVQLIAHPNFEHQFWPSHDVGIIKTTENRKFQGAFKLVTSEGSRKGHAILFGCGRIDASPKQYARTTGENDFVTIGSVLTFFGKSSQSDIPGLSVSIAPNDSGGPIVDQSTGAIIGVASQTTVQSSRDYGLPAISLATSLESSSNAEFFKTHLGPVNAKAPPSPSH